MGDRANILVQEYRDSEQGIYLYTHWSGERLPYLLQEVLSRRARWNDGAYLTRMIFSKMVEKNISDETGYGISLHIPDNESGRPIIKVYISQQIVNIGRGSWTFEDYINLTEEDIQQYYT